MKKTITVFLGLGMILICAAGITASEENASGQELKKEIIRVNYIDPMRAWQIISTYKSSRGKVTPLRERSLIIIEDTPEVVEKMLDILRRIDIKPVDLEFKVDLVLATDEDSEPAPELPEYPSGPVVNELKKLLRYEEFQKLDTALIRVQNNERAVQQMGHRTKRIPKNAEEARKNVNLDLELNIRPHYIRDKEKEGMDTELRLVKKQGFTDGKPVTSVLFDTSLTMTAGEKTVVGVSKLLGSGHALIMILEGRVIK